MIVSQTTLTNDLTEAQIEQLADEDRDTQNTWNAYLRDRLAVLESGCFCESDRTWLGHLPDDHEAGSCRCVCDACSDRREWTGYWREAEVEQGKEDEWYAGQLARIRREKRAADGADSDEYLWYKGQLYAIADGKRVEEPWQAEVRAKVEQERLRQEREQLEADYRAAAAHRTWLASPEGMVQTAREEAEREDERRERTPSARRSCSARTTGRGRITTGCLTGRTAAWSGRPATGSPTSGRWSPLPRPLTTTGWPPTR